MKQRIILFLSNKYNATIVFLGAMVAIDVAGLIFVPYKYHVWIQNHYTTLLWVALVLMTLIVVIMAKKIYSNSDGKTAGKTHTPSILEPDDMYRFYDEKGELKLLVQSQMVYFIEGADNYVVVYYSQGNKVEHIIIRNTLRNIAWRFRDQRLVRCHRSYIVNCDKVKMLKRVDGDILLDLGVETLPNIPVSKSYSEIVLNRLSKNL